MQWERSTRYEKVYCWGRNSVVKKLLFTVGQIICQKGTINTYLDMSVIVSNAKSERYKSTEKILGFKPKTT